jgi:hypothetical protein
MIWQVLYLWQEAGIFGAEDKEQFLVRPFWKKYASARNRILPVITALDQRPTRTKKIAPQTNQRQTTNRKRPIQGVINCIEEACRAKRRSGADVTQTAHPVQTTRRIVHALLDTLNQLPVEDREGIRLVRNFNSALRLALNGEKKKLLALQRLAKPNHYLYVQLEEDLKQEIPRFALGEIERIDQAQACIRKVETFIAEMIRNRLGKKSRLHSTVGLELVYILKKKASFPINEAIEWAFKLMHAYDPDRIGDDFRSFRRKVLSLNTRQNSS